MNGNQKRPPRFRFSLRELLVLLAAVGIISGLWLGPEIRRAERQRAAVKALKALGGNVAYEYNGDSPWWSATGWLQALFGEKYFGRMVRADVHGGSAGQEADFSFLAEFSDLESLSISGKIFGDGSLAYLEGHNALHTLDLGGTAVSSQGFRMLDGLPNLERLDLSETKIDDDGVGNIARFNNLTSIDLSNSQIGDRGLTELHKCPRLAKLWLKGRPISDTGLAALSGMPTLTRLELTGAAITESGAIAFHKATPSASLLLDEAIGELPAASHLGDVTSIEWKTAFITDASIELLLGASQLDRVTLVDCGTTDRSLEIIGKISSLSRLFIVRGNGPDERYFSLHSSEGRAVIHMRGRDFTDETLKALATHLNMKQLKHLSIGNASVDGSGFLYLPEMKTLDSLSLFDCPLRVDFLELLTRHQELRGLTIRDCELDDAAIDFLAKLRWLQRLDVQGAKFTYFGGKRLKASLPECQVEWEFPNPFADPIPSHWRSTKPFSVAPTGR